jgi:hypothetical protein
MGTIAWICGSRPMKNVIARSIAIQFVFIVKLIQVKSMEVIYKMKNILNKEFQNWVESQLIEVMKMKMKMEMEMIQFGIIVKGNVR